MCGVTSAQNLADVSNSKCKSRNSCLRPFITPHNVKELDIADSTRFKDAVMEVKFEVCPDGGTLKVSAL